MRLYLFFCYVLAFSCAAFSSAAAQSFSSRDCPEIKVKAEITHTTSAGENGEIELTFDEAPRSDQYIILLTCPGCAEAKKAVDHTFKNLKAGYYDIYVVDKQGCSKQLNLQVD